MQFTSNTRWGKPVSRVTIGKKILKTRQGHCTIDRLEERGTEIEAHCEIPCKHEKRALSDQTKIKTVSKAALGKLLKLLFVVVFCCNYCSLTVLHIFIHLCAPPLETGFPRALNSCSHVYTCPSPVPLEDRVSAHP